MRVVGAPGKRKRIGSRDRRVGVGKQEQQKKNVCNAIINPNPAHTYKILKGLFMVFKIRAGITVRANIT